MNSKFEQTKSKEETIIEGGFIEPSPKEPEFVCQNFEKSLSVGELLKKLNFALENGEIKETDSIMVIGSNYKASLISNICLPKLSIPHTIIYNKMQIGFTDIHS